MKLTPASIRPSPCPMGVSEKTFFDDTLPDSASVSAPSGAKSFVVQYKIHSKNRRIVLGPAEVLDLGKARASAKDILARVRLARTPPASGSRSGAGCSAFGRCCRGT